jgi:hypothetical protein
MVMPDVFLRPQQSVLTSDDASEGSRGWLTRAASRHRRVRRLASVRAFQIQRRCCHDEANEKIHRRDAGTAHCSKDWRIRATAPGQVFEMRVSHFSFCKKSVLLRLHFVAQRLRIGTACCVKHHLILLNPHDVASRLVLAQSNDRFDCLRTSKVEQEKRK